MDKTEAVSFPELDNKIQQAEQNVLFLIELVLSLTGKWNFCIQESDVVLPNSLYIYKGVGDGGTT